MPDNARGIFPHGQLPGSLELAFVGDSVWDLYVRAHLVRRGGRMKALNREAVGHVNASAQSEALSRIEEGLTDEEKGVVMRARNARQTPTKNADPGDYHRATALEALVGYLYLTGQQERMAELLALALPDMSD